MKTVPGLKVRLAGADDAEIVHDFVTSLAKFEKLAEVNLSTVESLRTELADEHGELEAIIAELDGKPVAMVSFFRTYSTFAARRGIYIEDIFVYPEYRQQGIGAELMRYLGRLAVERGYGRIEWTTLLWNTPAIEFFEALGAAPSDAWTTFRLDGDYIQRLAQS